MQGGRQILSLTWLTCPAFRVRRPCHHWSSASVSFPACQRRRSEISSSPSQVIQDAAVRLQVMMFGALVLHRFGGCYAADKIPNSQQTFIFGAGDRVHGGCADRRWKGGLLVPRHPFSDQLISGVPLPMGPLWRRSAAGLTPLDLAGSWQARSRAECER